MEATDIRRAVLPPTHWTVFNAMSVLGGVYASAGEFDKAEPLLLEAFKGLESGAGIGRRPRIDAADRLATLYDKWGKPDQARRWLTARRRWAGRGEVTLAGEHSPACDASRSRAAEARMRDCVTSVTFRPVWVSGRPPSIGLSR